MRIATVTPYDLSLPGGVNRYALDVARWVRGQGHHVDVIGPASSANGLTPGDVIPYGHPQRIASGGTVAPIALDPVSGSAVRALLGRGRYDVVHLHEPLMPVLPLQCLRHSQAPTLGTFHAAEASGRRVYRLAGPALTRWTRRLRACTAISETARDTAAPVLHDPCHVIGGGSDLARFAAPAALPVELAQRLTDGHRTILFVGRAEPRKGLADLVEAYGRLRERHHDLRLLVVGPPGSCGAAIRARVEGAGWEDVIFTGPVADAELPAYYQAAHVFAAPATGGESFGLVLTEAMAAGAAVVAGDNPGYRAVVRHERDGILVPPANPTELATAIERLLDDEPLRRRFAAAGRARAAAFDIRRVGQRYLALYHALAGTGPAAQRESTMPQVAQASALPPQVPS